MVHWRKFMDPREYIYAEDLVGRDVDVRIARIVAGELAGEKGRKSKKPLAYFEGKSRPLALNKTNCKAIERITGSADTDKWIGQWITLFPTQTADPNGNQVDCVRVRPRAPSRKAGAPRNTEMNDDARPDVATSDAEPGADPAESQGAEQ